MELVRELRGPLLPRVQGCSCTTFDKVISRAQQKEADDGASPGGLFYYSQQTKSADEVLATIRTIGAEAHAWEADLSDASMVPTLFDRAERLLGPVEVLVNNAAYWEGDTFVPPGAELDNKLVELWTDRPRSITAAVFDQSVCGEYPSGSLDDGRVCAQAH